MIFFLGLYSVEKSDGAQELSAGINIQLDTGTVAKILGNIQLSAVMGFTKIQIPKAFQVRKVIPCLIRCLTLGGSLQDEKFLL
jgi:hypothetical protein